MHVLKGITMKIITRIKQTSDGTILTKAVRPNISLYRIRKTRRASKAQIRAITGMKLAKNLAIIPDI
jgi:hypothetical protein